MRNRLITGFILCLVLIPANVAAAACEFNGRDTVLTGVFSSEWEATKDITAFNEASGVPVTFGGTFHHLFEGRDNTFWILDEVWRAGATPVANVEVPVSAAAIARGDHDDAIRAWAEGVVWWLNADPQHALIIAPMQEMNGNWVPWGMDPINFKIAYRKFIQIVSEFGVDETQVRWMFAPNGVSVFPYSATDYWPGDDVVDIVGLSAYNFGHEFGEWQTLDDVLFDVTQQLRAFARDKPFVIAQIGTSQQGGDREAWLSEMFAFVADDPNHIGFVYFNFDKETNWRVWDGVSVADGWLTALEDERVSYQFPLESWFRQGRIPFSFNPGTVYPKPNQYCTSASVESPPQFNDVSDGLFYSPAVSWLARVGLTTGYTDGTFRPDQPVTRAEAITLLWRMACAPTDVPGSGFSDVDEQPFRPAVDWGVATEIVNGYPDGTFKPNDFITRSEIATLLWRMNHCGDAGDSAIFDDVPARSFFGAAVGWMSFEGITSGVAPRQFGAAGQVTRGELATFLFRLPQN